MNLTKTLFFLCAVLGLFVACGANKNGSKDDSTNTGPQTTFGDGSDSADDRAWERITLKPADRSWVYKLPYSPGTSWKVTQSYFIGGTHDGYYAIDWLLDENAPICAARDGQVTDMVDANDWDDSQLGSSEALPCNWVEIRHADGSFSFYNHIAHKSARVKVGQTVKAGDVIALCGRVGAFSGAFHLHFEVYKFVNGIKDTYPIVFWSGKKEPYEIFLGAVYYAPRFEGDEPEVTKGATVLSDIRNTLWQVGKQGKTLREGRILIRDHLKQHFKEYGDIWRSLMKRVTEYDAAAAKEIDLILGQNDLYEHVGLSEILDALQPDDILNEIEALWAQMFQS
jgi:murein DD-endopeptidase MepM/ murein hydrolase activator NlpD